MAEKLPSDCKKGWKERRNMIWRRKEKGKAKGKKEGNEEGEKVNSVGL